MRDAVSTSSQEVGLMTGAGGSTVTCMVESDREKHVAGVRWWVAFLASTLLVVFGHLLMKAGLLSMTVAAPAHTLGGRLLEYLTQPWLVEGLALYVVGSLLWMAAIAQKDVSFLYPLTSVNYVLVVAGSALVFHEVISARRWMGVAFIVTGVLLLSRSEGYKQR